jgi:hypothetical protein
MYWFRRIRPLPGRAEEYASPADFCRIFKKEMTSLYCLALALTADEYKAEQCFVSGLQECISGNAVFKEWAHNWSKRIVIKKAIQLVSPASGTNGFMQVIGANKEIDPSPELVPAAVTQLPSLERFVFVMSVLESYSDRECSTLLGCSPSQVVKARNKALQGIRRAPAFASLEPVGDAAFSDGLKVAG